MGGGAQGVRGGAGLLHHAEILPRCCYGCSNLDRSGVDSYSDSKAWESRVIFVYQG